MTRRAKQKENWEVPSDHTWDKISKSFAYTRQKPWSQVIDFINSLPKSASLLDLGSGNGRHALPAAMRVKKVVAADVSGELLKIVEERAREEGIGNIETVDCDARKMPFEDGSFDACIFIAALHNIETRRGRRLALAEVARVLKPGGVALVTVWARWQDRHIKDFSKEIFRWPLKKLAALATRKNYEFGDIDLPWTHHGMRVSRFYHMYTMKELANDVCASGLLIDKKWSEKIRSKKRADNHFLICEKWVLS